MGLPFDECMLVHISFANVVHSILCFNLLLLVMNHTTWPESGCEVASWDFFAFLSICRACTWYMRDDLSSNNPRFSIRVVAALNS